MTSILRERFTFTVIYERINNRNERVHTESTIEGTLKSGIDSISEDTGVMAPLVDRVSSTIYL